MSRIGTWLKSAPKNHSAERIVVRLFVPLGFAAAGVLAYEIAKRAEEAPSVAFHNRLVYAGLLFLLIFYGLLLLVLPLVRAIVAGELPIELTTKGPRYPEKGLASSRKAAEAIEKQIASVEDRLQESIKATATKASEGISAVQAEARRETDRLDGRINRGSRSKFFRI